MTEGKETARQMRITKAETETIIRWDEEERVLRLWTSSVGFMRRMARRGYVWTRTSPGWGWEARASLKAFTLRRLGADGYHPPQREGPLRVADPSVRWCRGARGRRLRVQVQPEPSEGKNSDEKAPGDEKP